jgi:hypothetical protein
MLVWTGLCGAGTPAREMLAALEKPSSTTVSALGFRCWPVLNWVECTTVARVRGQAFLRLRSGQVRATRFVNAHQKDLTSK